MHFKLIMSPRHIKICFFSATMESVLLWMLDTNTSPTEIPGGVLHQNVTSGTEQSISYWYSQKETCKSMFTLPTRWRTNTLDRLSPAAAAEGQNDVLASLAATILRYRQEAHFRWGKSSSKSPGHCKESLHRCWLAIQRWLPSVTWRIMWRQREAGVRRGWCGFLRTTLRKEASLWGNRKPKWSAEVAKPFYIKSQESFCFLAPTLSEIHGEKSFP